MKANNADLKQYVIDFVEGRVEARDFMIRFRDDPALAEWLQSIVPEGKVAYMTDPNAMEWMLVEIPYDIHFQIDKDIEKFDDLGNQYNVHCEISRLILEVFSDEGIEKSNKFKKRFNFLIKNCPNSVGGPEADAYIGKILNEIPEDLPTKTRIQMFRARIKEEFHLDGKRYPYWLQEAEWPMNNGKPMRYVSQASKGEMRFYLFEDVETGEERVVFQSY